MKCLRNRITAEVVLSAVCFVLGIFLPGVWKTIFLAAAWLVSGYHVAIEAVGGIFRGQLLELDVYTFSDRFATLEIELPSIDTPVEIPSFVQVLRDVTDDERYSNYALSEQLRFPE